MKKTILGTSLLMIMSIDIHAENLIGYIYNLNNTPTEYNVADNISEPIEIKSVRGFLGEYDLMEHTKGQLRTGYITFLEDGASRTSSYALAGHYHFNTKRWNGLMIGAEAYTVLNLGINQNSLNINGDFFDDKGNSFISLTKAFLGGKWGNTELKLGRQSLDTPHADSDDIRMMPNYFEAYTVTNMDIDNLTLTAGFINKMAGWENGINSADFVDVGETLGTDKIDGISYASISYELMKDLSLSLWYYNYSDIANVVYAEAGYSYELSKNVLLTLGLQYDASHETGASLLGKQDAQTYGVSVESKFEDLGVTVLAAYNKDSGDTGAMSLSLGGGTFFTSMEDQTLDALGMAGEAWIIGTGYNFKNLGINDLTFGVAYGSFEADDASIYKSREADAVLEYNFNDQITATATYASVDFRVSNIEDYNQFTAIVNYNF